MKGSCNCNSVKFEILNQVSSLYQCHCKLCQKQSGSSSNTAAIVRGEDFVWLLGEDAISHWKKESGFTSDFCKHCGSPVPNRLRSSDYYWIPMGLVEDCTVKITTHVCCGSKASWDVINDNAVQYYKMPDDLEAFLASL